MSEQIDWSKAPEWATKHGLSGAFKSPVWFDDKKYTYVDGQQDGKSFFYADACTYAAKDFSQVSERPTTPSWSGEGLPPVGVVCEYCCVNDKWRQVKVIAHMIEMQKDKPCAVSQLGDTGPLCIGGASSFRPIRTPEQIAADEREAAIKELQREMMPAYDAFAEPILDVITRLGYRKP